MVKIRLQRTGTKGEPHYRLVAADSRFPRDGRFIEIVGQYHPTAKTTEKMAIFHEEKIMNWLNKGAQPTGTVANLLKSSGVWTKYKAAKAKK